MDSDGNFGIDIMVWPIFNYNYCRNQKNLQINVEDSIVERCIERRQGKKYAHIYWGSLYLLESSFRSSNLPKTIHWVEKLEIFTALGRVKETLWNKGSLLNLTESFE